MSLTAWHIGPHADRWLHLLFGGSGCEVVNSNCYQRVFEALCTRSMVELARASYEILHMPVVVTDAAFIVRVKYPDTPQNDEQWDANVTNRQIEPRFVKTFTDDDHFAQHDKAQRAILTDWGHYATAPRLTQILKANGNSIGYFAALATGVDVQPWHYEACGIISEAFAMMMEADAGAQLARAGMSSPALYALLDGSIDASTRPELLPQGFVEEHAAPYILFCAKPRNPYNAPLEAYLGNALALYFEHSIRTVFDGCLYLLACEVSSGARGSVRGNLLIDELGRQALDCGVSRIFDDLGEIKLRSWEATSALSVGALLNPGDYLHHYEDYIADIALRTLVANVPDGALEHPALAVIKRHDVQNHTEYFKTLQVYFESQFDKKRTCERLHVHRNTLQYRLDRIAEIQDLISIDDSYLPLYFAVEDYARRVEAAEARQRRDAQRGEGM